VIGKIIEKWVSVLCILGAGAHVFLLLDYMVLSGLEAILESENFRSEKVSGASMTSKALWIYPSREPLLNIFRASSWGAPGRPWPS